MGEDPRVLETLLENQRLLKKQTAGGTIRNILLTCMTGIFLVVAVYAVWTMQDARARLDQVAGMVDNIVELTDDIQSQLEKIDFDQLNDIVDNLHTITGDLRDTADGLKAFSESVGKLNPFSN